MNEWTWGYLVWGLRWLLFGFLAWEIPAKDVTGLAPWPSLSATTWHVLGAHPWFSPILFALIIFLVTHLMYHRHVLISIGYGLLIAGAFHLFDKKF